MGEISGTIAGPEWKKERIKENWYGGDTVNYSIGQGYVLMTPVQLLRAYAAVANGGKLPKTKDKFKAVPEFRKLEVSPETIKIMQEGLREVTSTGTGRRASSFGVDIAGDRYCSRMRTAKTMRGLRDTHRLQRCATR